MSKRYRHTRGKARTAERADLSVSPIFFRRSLVLFVLFFAATLLLWRLVLLSPMLALSRDVMEASFSLLASARTDAAELITADGNGDWIVRASLLFQPRQVTRQTALPEPDVRTPRRILQSFSLAFPIFWALALAVGSGKRLGPVLGLGTLLLTIVSQLSLVVFLAYWINFFYVVTQSPLTGFLLHMGGYCALNVIPYAAPLVLIIWLEPRLRSQLLGGSIPQTPTARES
jgi:hypothetical protein